PDEIAACRPFLDQQVALIDPAVVLSLGRFATCALLGSNEPIGRLRGREFRLGARAVLVPTFHPAAALRGGGQVLAQMRSDFVRAKEAVRRARAGAVAGAGGGT
ncbi:MAG: uracil-DNA glycosylase family protein, partial [Acidimicrobiales bacterium]